MQIKKPPKTCSAVFDDRPIEMETVTIVVHENYVIFVI